MQVHTIDLEFQGVAGAIAAYLLSCDEGLILVESGPYSSYEELKAGIVEAGYAVSEIDHLLITHVHFDHAGAAWAVARESDAIVHVHPLGERHLANPDRLWNSAKQIYGAAGMERLWGPMEGIPPQQLSTWTDGESRQILGAEVTAIHSPGHAKHHIAWQVGQHLFLGDVGGVQVEDGPVEPPCPPPDIDVEAWQTSISRLVPHTEGRTCYLGHFGAIQNARDHFTTLSKKLTRWTALVEAAIDEGDMQEGEKRFTEAIEAERGAFALRYSLANPAFMSWPGLVRYITKRAEAQSPAGAGAVDQ